MLENEETKLSITYPSFLNSDGNLCHILRQTKHTVNWLQVNTDKYYAKDRYMFDYLINKGSYYYLTKIGALLYV